MTVENVWDCLFHKISQKPDVQTILQTVQSNWKGVFLVVAQTILSFYWVWAKCGVGHGVGQCVKARYNILCKNMVHQRRFELRSSAFKALRRDNHYTTGTTLMSALNVGEQGSNPHWWTIFSHSTLYLAFTCWLILLCSFDITGHYSDPIWKYGWFT